MLRTQIWTPDTEPAGTTFTLQWDDVNLDAPHVCIAATVGGWPYHGNLQQVYEHALAHNNAVNLCQGHATVARVNRRINDVDGALELSLSGLNAGQKRNVEDFLKTRFGGMVRVL